MLFAQGLVIDTASVLIACGVVITAFGVLFKLLIGSKDELVKAEKARADALEKKAEEQRAVDRAEAERLYKELESRKKSHEEIAAEAVKSNREMAAYILRQQGKPPLEYIAPVISESQSPSTEKQREEARIATLRAEMAQIKKAVGQEARVEPERMPAADDDSVMTTDHPKIIEPAAEGVEIKVDKMRVGEIILDTEKKAE